MSKPDDEIPNPSNENPNAPNASIEISKFVITMESPTTENDLILPSNSRNV